nr:copia protein [Tanacetum cinerariifolium]
SSVKPVERTTQAENLRKDIPKSRVPTSVLNRSRLVPLNVARPVTTNVPQTTVTRPRPFQHVFNKENSPIRRPIHHRPAPKHKSFHKPVLTVKGNPQQALKDKGVIDSGCSRHMTGNISYLSDFKEINGGYVAFGGNPKGGKITGKDTEFVVLPSDFKLRDENHGNPQQALKDKGVIDSGCSRHVTGNISFLSDFKEINGGYVAFGGNPKGGKITGKGSEPTWLFDIDNLTQSMNYHPVVTGNQPNHNVGIQGNFDAGKVVKETESSQQYEPESAVHVSSSSSDKTKKHDEKTKREAKGLSIYQQVPSDNAVSTTFEIGRKSLFVDPSQYLDDPDMPALEDIVYSDDEENVDAYADFSNLETNKEYGKDEEPKRVHQALKDPSWIEAMQEELLQFKIQKIWVLIDLPKGKRVIGSKWVFRNKKDKRGIVIRNKSLFVAQGHTQEEGIDYKEVFALVARIEAIRLFLAYASFMGFMVYQMDEKSEFIYGTIEEVYVCQPIGFEDPDYPNKVYKVVKALYGLHQAPRACQDKYVAEILRMFDFTDGKSASTPIETEKPLLKDPNAEDVDTVVATSSTEAEYIAAASCCAQVLWIQNQLLDYGPKLVLLVLIEAQHQISNESPLLGVNTPRCDEDSLEIMEFMVFLVPSCYKLMLFGLTNDVVHLMMLGFDQIVDFMTAYAIHYALMVTPTIYVSCIKHFWASVSIKKSNDAVKLQALIDRKKVIITEDIIRQALRLDDADGIDCLPNEEIFAKLAQIGLLRMNLVLLCPQLSSALPQDVAEVNTEDEDDNEVSAPPAPPSPTPAITPPLPQQEPIPSPPQVTIVAPITTGAQVQKTSASRKRRGVVLQDPKETATTSVIMHSKNDVIDQVKRKEKHDNEVIRCQALKRKPVTEAQARMNMMIYLKNMVGFKMDFFKDGTHKLFLSIIILLENFDREDLETLWKLIKEGFESTEPKNFLDDFLLNIPKIMFEKPNIEANV